MSEEIRVSEVRVDALLIELAKMYHADHPTPLPDNVLLACVLEMLGPSGDVVAVKGADGVKEIRATDKLRSRFPSAPIGQVTILVDQI